MMQFKSSMWLGLFIITLIVFLAPENVFAASCPYCGKSYGAAKRGDEERVQALRRSHEASCPSRRTDDPPPYTGPTPEELRIEKMKNDSRAANNKGVEYYNNGDYDTALQYFEEAWSINPDNMDAKQNIADAKKNIANVKRRENDEEVDALLQKGKAFLSTGFLNNSIEDLENAVKYFKKALLEYSGSDDNYILVIRSRLDEAEFWLESRKKDRWREGQRDLILSDLMETTSVSAVEQLESLQMHGLAAVGLSKKGTIYNFKLEAASGEARKIFDDSRGDRVKGKTLKFSKYLGKNPLKESVVTDEDRKRSPEIAGIETKRYEARERRLKSKEKLERLNNIPKEKRSQEWSAKIAKVNQDISDADNEEIFFNFKINVILRESEIRK